MTGRSFWVISFVLLATACHLAFVLFGSGFDNQTAYDRLVAVAGTNKLQALSTQQANLLSSFSDNKLVHAVCAYDLSQGSIRLTAKFPDNYWSVSIYTAQGDVIYTLNDRQANANSLSIIISAGSAELATDSGTSIGQTSSGDITVVSEYDHGLAVLRGSLINEQKRKRVTETLNRSECKLVTT